MAKQSNLPQLRTAGHLQTNVYDSKIKRTLASFCGFSVNLYLMWGQELSQESQLFFALLFLTTLVISVREQDISYLFCALAVCYVPYIAIAAGFAPASFVALLVAIVVLAFQRGVSMKTLSEGAFGLADKFSKSNIRRKIIKLSDSEIEPEQLLEEDLEEFTLVEKELAKVKKSYARSSGNIQHALKQTIAQIDQLQKDHARVMVRGAGLGSFLSGVDKSAQEAELQNYIKQHDKCADEVAKAQLAATIKMKKDRIAELDRLDTCLNRVKLQKIQMKEMFNGLMDKMNTLKFTDVITLQASSDDMVQQVTSIRNGLEDLEKGLIEAEKSAKLTS